MLRSGTVKAEQAAAVHSRAESAAAAVGTKFMILPLLTKLQPKKIPRWQFFIRVYWPWLSASLLMLVIFLLLAPYLFRPWTRYPEPLRAEIAWRYFQASFSGVCREECLAERQAYAAIWRPFYQREPELAATVFRQAFAEGGAELQAAIIKIMAADSDAKVLPPFLAEVIADPSASAENKRLIVTFFAAAFQDEAWLSSVRDQVLDKNLNLAEREYALSLLAAFPDETTRELLKILILQDSPINLLTLATRIWSSLPVQTWSAAELQQLQQLIVTSSAGPARWRRLWLLNAAAQEQGLMARAHLVAIAENQSLDAISRGLAAETLLTLFQVQINTPTPSAGDWQQFYESL